jgi:hypothetical protein
MMKKIMIISILAFMSLTAGGQTRDPNNKYLVWTNNVVFKKESEVIAEAKKEEQADKGLSFIEKNFRFLSMCDWLPDSTRFMVVPSKKDMVIRTFADSTDQMVSSMSLRYKVMIYKGHQKDEGLHERVHFVCEDDGKSYYFEVPTATFSDYCYTKYGVPTLAYLGDVDKAIDKLIGKRLLTRQPRYNVDVNTTSYGYDKIDVPLGTEVTVVAAGVGTRSYPVKLIVADQTGKEFFQTVAISRTNSGMSDDEFEEDDEIKHTFEGSFELIEESDSPDKMYQKYVGNNVFTLLDTRMELPDGMTVNIPRLTGFTIVAVHAMPENRYVKMTLQKEGREYVKYVTFERESVVGDIAGESEDYYFSLFASGNLGQVEGVREQNMDDIRKHIVREGFNEAEVRLALGEPDGHGRTNAKGLYTWVYKSALSRNNCTVFFDASTKKVKYIKK